MRDQSNAIREQVSFKQREEHIRDSWSNLCAHYNLNLYLSSIGDSDIII